MVEVRGVAGSSVERVAEDAPIRRTRGATDHELVATGGQLRAQLPERHPGLDHRVAEGLVHLHDVVHVPPQMHHRLPRADRGELAQTEVLTGAARPQRDVVLVGELHDQLDLTHGPRVQHTARAAVATRQPVGPVGGERVVGEVHRVLAQFRA